MDVVRKYIDNENLEIENVIIFRNSIDVFFFFLFFEVKK